MAAHSFSREYLDRHYSNGEPWLDASCVPDADVASYRVLNHAWSVDRDRVYLRGKPLRQVDRASFRVLNELYARDDQRIFCAEGRLDELVDPATFEVLDEGWYERWNLVSYWGYARDRRYVYCGERPRIVADADPTSFEVLERRYARDRNAVYLEGRRVESAHPSTFEILDEHYARDHERVFYLGSSIEGVQPASFQPMGDFLARDMRNVYDRGAVIEHADPGTFEPILGTSLAVDGKHVFVSGQLQERVDRASFQHLGHDYYADNSGIHHGDTLLKGAHRKSFVVDGYGYAHDRTRRYVQDKVQRGPVSLQQARRLFLFFTFPLRLPFVVISVLIKLIRDTPEPSQQPRMAETPREADMVVLATVLANGRLPALAPVMLAIEDMDAFRERYCAGVNFADEPRYDELLDRVDDSAEMHAFDVLQVVYEYYDLLGVIDWRSATEETMRQIEPMLRYHGIERFDWRFVDVLEQQGDGTELRNNNFLTLLQDRLAALGLTLVHVNLYSDSYAFAIVMAAAYEQIAGFEIEGRFRISRDFGPDEGYDRGKRLLASVIKRDAGA